MVQSHGRKKTKRTKRPDLEIKKFILEQTLRIDITVETLLYKIQTIFVGKKLI